MGENLTTVASPRDGATWGRYLFDSSWTAPKSAPKTLRNQLRWKSAGSLEEISGLLAVRGYPNVNKIVIWERDTFTFNFPRPLSALVDESRRYYGPMINVVELRREREGMFLRQNQSANPATT